MKIKHFNLLNSGGAFTAARRIVDGQIESGLDATLITQADLGPHEILESRIKSKLDFELNKLIKPPLTISYFNSIKNIGSDSILNLHWLPGPLPIDICSPIEIPAVIWTLHDTNPFTAICHNPFECDSFVKNCSNCPQKGFMPGLLVEKKLRKKKNRALIGRNFHVVAPSHWIADLASKSSVFANTPIHVIPNSLPLDVFSPTQRILNREQLGIQNYFVIGFLSPNLGEAKGGMQAKNIFQAFSARHAGQIKGIEIGDEEVDEFSNIIGMKPSSELEMSKVLKACDVLIYASLADNLPNFLLEAQACGTPVISVDIGGSSECFEVDSTGFIFKDDEEAISHLEKLYLHPLRRNEFSKNARKYAEQNFDPKNIADKYFRVYQEAVSS